LINGVAEEGMMTNRVKTMMTIVVVVVMEMRWMRWMKEMREMMEKLMNMKLTMQVESVGDDKRLRTATLHIVGGDADAYGDSRDLMADDDDEDADDGDGIDEDKGAAVDGNSVGNNDNMQDVAVGCGTDACCLCVA
jgi:hypothetical protein